MARVLSSLNPSDYLKGGGWRSFDKNWEGRRGRSIGSRQDNAKRKGAVGAELPLRGVCLCLCPIYNDVALSPTEKRACESIHQAGYGIRS